jgi:hypothetical protein
MLLHIRPLARHFSPYARVNPDKFQNIHTNRITLHMDENAANEKNKDLKRKLD